MTWFLSGERCLMGLFLTCSQLPSLVLEWELAEPHSGTTHVQPARPCLIKLQAASNRPVHYYQILMVVEHLMALRRLARQSPVTSSHERSPTSGVLPTTV